MRILILLFLIASSAVVKADYSRMTFLEVLDGADLVAESEIVAVNDSFFWIKLNYLIKGSSEKKVIKVRKFRNWPSAQRFKNYEIGQKELVALVWETKLKCWRPIGAGNEGELPLVNGKITFRKLLYGKNNYKSQTYKRIDVYDGIKYYLKNIENLQSKIKNGTILELYPDNLFTNALIKTIIWKNQRTLDSLKS